MTVDAELAAGDVVVVRWHAEGTHDGEIMGSRPTGNDDTTHGMSWIRYEDGKAVESWTQWDVLGLHAEHRRGTERQRPRRELIAEISAGRGGRRSACSPAASPASWARPRPGRA